MSFTGGHVKACDLARPQAGGQREDEFQVIRFFRADGNELHRLLRLERVRFPAGAISPVEPLDPVDAKLAKASALEAAPVKRKDGRIKSAIMKALQGASEMAREGIWARHRNPLLLAAGGAIGGAASGAIEGKAHQAIEIDIKRLAAERIAAALGIPVERLPYGAPLSQ